MSSWPRWIQALMPMFVFYAACCGAEASHSVSWGFDTSGASITVKVGDVVTWTLDQGPSNHTLTSPALSSALGFSFDFSLSAKSSFSWVSDVPPGSYPYYCSYHPTTVFAVLTVEPASSEASSTHPVNGALSFLDDIPSLIA
jgi:plastocyanin